MTQIVIGTTPAISYTVKTVSPSDFRACILTIKCNGQILIEKARLKGESKYHEVVSRAAVSTYAEHGAILFSSQCNPIKNGCCIHTPHSAT